MRRFQPALALVVLSLLTAALAVPPAAAAASGASSASNRMVASAGTRVDQAGPPAFSPPASPPAGSRASNPHFLDGKVTEEAKAIANAAAGGIKPNARNDFSISASPASQTVAQGTGVTFTVTTAVTKGSAQSIALSLSSTPGGVTGTFTPSTITAGGSSTLSIATGSVAPSTYTLTITGTGTNTTRKTSVTLTVTSPTPTADFTIAANPTSLSIAQGASGQSAISTTQVGSAGTVGLAAAVSPSGQGVTASLNPTSVAAGSGSTLTVSASAGATIGGYTVTVTGTEGSATHQAQVAVTITGTSASGPTTGLSWVGQFQSNLAPPDPTGAMGSSSYIELINLRFGIYDRTTNALVGAGAQGTLATLTGLNDSLSDPQIIWDPSAQRFYYLVLDVSRYGYAFGWSKTANPTQSTDFCQYITDFGYGKTSSLPDYPKMAVTNDYVLVGANIFLGSAIYTGSDVDWFVKPAATAGDTTCPATLGAGGVFSSLKNTDGSLTSTPVPAQNAEATSTGYVVGSYNVGSGSASSISVFRVTKGASSALISSANGVSVASYSVPADAKQPGTTALLDTMDSRLEHAVAGYDPRIGSWAVWTAHTVFGGAGAEARWYEINVGGASPVLAQSGKVSDSTFYAFNAAISPDRAANDTSDSSAVTGSSMVMGFSTSSTSAYSALQMVSKKGSNAQSGWVLVKQSTGANIDFTCGPTCRWGDYAGAYPDPLVSSGGKVWLSGEWNLPATNGSTPVWQTWNWSATP